MASQPGITITSLFQALSKRPAFILRISFVLKGNKIGGEDEICYRVRCSSDFQTSARFLNLFSSQQFWWHYAWSGHEVLFVFKHFTNVGWSSRKARSSRRKGPRRRAFHSRKSISRDLSVPYICSFQFFLFYSSYSRGDITSAKLRRSSFISCNQYFFLLLFLSENKTRLSLLNKASL